MIGNFKLATFLVITIGLHVPTVTGQKIGFACCTAGACPPPPFDVSMSPGCGEFREDLPDPFPSDLEKFVNDACIAIGYDRFCPLTNDPIGEMTELDYQCCDKDQCESGTFAGVNCQFYFGEVLVSEVNMICEDMFDQETCYICAAALGCADPHFKTWGGKW